MNINANKHVSTNYTVTNDIIIHSIINNTISQSTDYNIKFLITTL